MVIDFWIILKDIRDKVDYTFDDMKEPEIPKASDYIYDLIR
jgi:hypothetical protein